MAGLLFRATLLVLAPLVGVATLGWYNGTAKLARLWPNMAVAAQNQPPVVIEQPSTWVPFSAELKRVHENDGTVFVGRQFRASDGSTRNETGRSFDAIDSIAVKNVPQSTFYRWTPEEGWTSQPMTLPPWGWKPVPTHWQEKMTKTDETVEGFDLIRFESVGRVFYQAPKLNLFTLVTQVPCKFDPVATCGTWYSNIKVNEQPPDYFWPSPGAPIVQRKEPGGIVWRPAR